MSSVSVVDLHVSRAGRPVVQGVDLDVAPGSVTALLGPNGAGKSTLVLAIAGLLTVERGSIRMGDLELVGKKPDVIRAAGLAAVPEGHRVLTRLSVRDNLLAARGRTPPQQALDTAFQLFHELAPQADHLAGSLSGGQQQMLAFAKALVCNPSVLVIDEMSLGLAPVIVKRLAGVVLQIAQGGIGVLLIEQYASVALGVAERAYVMHKGSISYSGSSRTLVEQPEVLHAAYFGAGVA